MEKNMKKLFFAFVLIALLMLSACGDGTANNGSTTDSAVSGSDSERITEAVGDESGEADITSEAGEAETLPSVSEDELVKLDNIEKYAVVRQKDASVSIKNAVTDLVADIFIETKVYLTVNTEDKAECEYEIIVGDVGRTVDGYEYGTLGLGSYIIKQIGTKIIIDGGSESAIENALNFFRINLSVAGEVKMPSSGEYVFAPEVLLDRFTIDGVSIEKYTVIEDLYNDEAAESFVKTLADMTMLELQVKNVSEMNKVKGNYILLSDTNTDFTEHSVRIEDGNIILSANYTTIEECVDYFFAELLGYDAENGKLTKGKSVELTSGTEKIFSVEKQTPYTREKLMQVLEDVYNSDSIIVGQHTNPRLRGETMTTERARYLENLGVECPLFGFDVAEAQEQGEKYPWNAQVKDAYDMVEYAREGGILTFSCHFSNPSGLPKNLAAYRGELGNGTAEDWENLLTPGTEYNTNFMQDLEKVGDFLMIFHENGVPIIFRPLHEMNGNWFWFCIVNGEQNNILSKDCAVRLWRLIYDYLVTERGIDSMIWEYSPNVSRGMSSTMTDVMYCYPGDDYCDIVGCDWYTGDYSGHEMLTIGEKALSETGKIFSVTEFGPGESIRTDYSVEEKDKFTCLHLDDIITEVTDAGIKTCYWLLWGSWAEVRISMYNMGDGRAFYGNDAYLTLDDTYKLLYE